MADITPEIRFQFQSKVIRFRRTRVLFSLLFRNLGIVFALCGLLHPLLTFFYVWAGAILMFAYLVHPGKEH